ncbi:hypothetical protein OSTOST_21873, partial [Ostertagia ostertagi]
ASKNPALLVLSLKGQGEVRECEEIFQVHKDGHLALLCSRPNCHEKKYANEPKQSRVQSNTSWVGGLQKTVDDELLLQCCEYDLMEKYGQLMFSNVIVRRGEFFEAEEKYDKNDEDVIYFDLISNIRRDYDEKGEFYSLTIYRYFCGRIPDTPPEWYMKKNWPYWPEQENLGS